MSEQKTNPTSESVDAFLAAIPDEGKRADCQKICKMMAGITGEPATMWGTAIVGYGSYHYVGASGRAGDWLITGFAPRKANITLHIMDGFDAYVSLLARLGKHSTGKSCLYIKRLSDVDTAVLQELIERSVRHMRSMY